MPPQTLPFLSSLHKDIRSHALHYFCRVRSLKDHVKVLGVDRRATVPPLGMEQSDLLPQTATSSNVGRYNLNTELKYCHSSSSIPFHVH